jgi:DNA topoisomerase-1
VTKPLIIVESPAKARTIAGYLGDEYEVASSVGHIRDLPSTAAEIPKKYKEEPWARLGVNVDDEFQPIYITSRGKGKVVTELRKKLKDAPALYLATDEDREGESIAWHLREVLKPKVPVKRMVFHEITPAAIAEALANPRELDERLVDAQETRRVLDRLYGYEVSPVLWRKVKPRLSAGRVQSVAVRIIVERERERIAFVSAAYWDIDAHLTGVGEAFTAGLQSIDGTRVASGRDFGSDGTLGTDDVVHLDEAGARALAEALTDRPFVVTAVDTRPYTRKPYAPFRTSTLQQEAGRKLGFSAARTMSNAQRLYENGYISYMRTDSTTLSETAIAAARDAARTQFGPATVPDEPRTYGKQAKGAQEAHEAIRPAGDEFKHPDRVAAEVEPDQARLYDLIWKRTVASQMVDAKGESLRVSIEAEAADGRTAGFTVSGRTITEPGFLAAYVQGTEEGGESDDSETRLPSLTVGDRLDATELEPKGHETKPPARFTEPSLVARLEELGVGRPSTYASIISTILAREYVFKKGSALVPSFTAFATVALLEQHFPELVDYDFTADMEGDLDRIARGEADRVEWLRGFYSGDDGLKAQIDARLDEIDPRAINSIPVGDGILARVGRYGPYLERGEDTASIPEDLPPDELTVAKATEYLDAAAAGPKILGTDPDSGMTVYATSGRYGPYVQLGEQEQGSKVKPKRASLGKGQSLDSISLDEALELLEWPKELGKHPDTGKPVVVSPGRYGPYVGHDGNYRTLASEDRLVDTTFERALLMLELPKGFVLLGDRTMTGERPIVDDPEIWLVRQRKKHYVWDGEVMATLDDTDEPSELSAAKAAELIARRREKLEAEAE